MTVKEIKEMIVEKYENECLFFKDKNENIYEISWTEGMEGEKEIVINDYTSFFKGNELFVEKTYACDCTTELKENKENLEIEIIEDIKYNYNK